MVWGMPPPRKFLEIRCSEITSDAILGQKQGRSSCMACGVLHPISMYAFAKPADFQFPQQKVLRLVEQQVGGGVISLEAGNL